MNFTNDNISWLDEIADTILPATKTPGAKAVKVSQFITVMVNDSTMKTIKKYFMKV